MSSTLLQRLHSPFSNSEYLLHRWQSIFSVLYNSICVSVIVDDGSSVIDESCKISHSSDVEDSSSF